MDSRLALPANTVLDDSYRIVRVVGSGGFGITYEAEDINLSVPIALKEYYPFDFGDRDSTMSVRPKSDRHKKTFQWGRANFLQEARTLARFEHPAIVRVTRVFEANSTAYMVMRFEQGQSFEDWLNGLGRPPTQEELDRIIAPVLDALQVMHAENFLHRDIAPDNIIVRADGTPVLLDFGAARRAVAEMSRMLTGVVKAGYSPHEQYSTDSRHQGPWSDIYALGGTLYRAVTGRTPMEAALRIDEDLMPSATKVAKGTYRPAFLAAIDTCLKVRHSERPKSVAKLRPLLLADAAKAKREPEPAPKVPTKLMNAPAPRSKLAPVGRARTGRWLAMAAAVVALLGGSYGGIEYMRWHPPGKPSATTAEMQRSAAAEAEARRQAAADAAAQRQAELDSERRRQEEEAAALRQAEFEADRRREADRRQREMAEASQRQADIEAEDRRRSEAERVAAADAAARRQAEEDDRRRAEERLRAATAVLSAEERSSFVRRVQLVLKESKCYDGSINGHSSETQDDLERFVASARKNGRPKPARIELAKATASDFEAWLRDADDSKGFVCNAKPAPARPQEAAKPRPPKQQQEAARPRPQRQREEASRQRQREEAPRQRAERPAPAERESSSGSGGGGLKLCAAGGRQMAVCN